jgi:hypothetical protein
MNRPYRSIEINLMPYDSVPKMQQVRPYIVGGILFILIIISMFVITLIFSNQTAKTEQQILAVDGQIRAIEIQIKERQTLGSVAEYLAIPEQLAATQPTTSTIVSELDRLVRPGMNVQSFEWLATNRMNVSISFASTEILIRFIEELKSSTLLKLTSSSGYNNIPTAALKPGEAGTGSLLPITQVSFDLTVLNPNQSAESPQQEVAP